MIAFPEKDEPKLLTLIHHDMMQTNEETSDNIVELFNLENDLTIKSILLMF